MKTCILMSAHNNTEKHVLAVALPGSVFFSVLCVYQIFNVRTYAGAFLLYENTNFTFRVITLKIEEF